MRHLSIFCLSLTIFTMSISASTVSKKEFYCPIDNEKFEAVVAMSGTSFGQRFDFKKLGPIYQPWPVPVCPSNGFVLFKDTFTKNELDILKPFILSEVYQQQRQDNTNFYLASLMSRRLGDNGWPLIGLLLSATWEAEFKHSERLPSYQMELEIALTSLLKTMNPGEDEWFNAQLLLANSLRRRGEFDDAFLQVEKIKLAYQNDDRAHLAKIINRLETIIFERDSRPRGIDSESDEYLTN